MAIGYASDNIVIAQIIGAAAVAVYAIPQKMFSFIEVVASMAVSPLWPAYGEALARGDVRWIRNTFAYTLRLVSILTTFISFFIYAHLGC